MDAVCIGIYLAREVSQTTKVVRAQFGHGLISDFMKVFYLQRIKNSQISF